MTDVPDRNQAIIDSTSRWGRIAIGMMEGTTDGAQSMVIGLGCHTCGWGSLDIRLS